MKLKQVKMMGVLLLTALFMCPIESSAEEGGKIAGKDRIETAVEISKRRARDNVILVNGTSFSDAISAISLAKKENASILLNQSEELDSRNKSEIQRVQAKKVFIIGGEKVISSSIEEELREGHEVIRIFGEDRFDTNKKVNEYVFTQMPETIIITNASAFADLLSISAYAYQNQIPIIISDAKGERLDLEGVDPRICYLVGGKGVLSRAVEKKAKNSIRIAGSNRYETSLAVQERFYQNQKDVFVTTGEHFADALAGVTLCDNGENILLAKRSTKEISDNSKYNFTLLGGRIQNGKGVALYVNPHQDDETIAMGLQMIKDKKDGKEIYIIQMTNGNKSIAVNKVNERLRVEERPEIDREEMHHARDLEVIDVLHRLGYPSEAFIDYGYPNEELTKDQVYNVVKSVCSFFQDTPIYIRTLDENEGFDNSRGKMDHIACYYGVKEFVEKEKNNIIVRYYLGHQGNEEIDGYTRIHASEEEKEIWMNLMDAYTVWDPENGRYAIGGVYSAKSAFDIMKKYHTNYYKSM